MVDEVFGEYTTSCYLIQHKHIGFFHAAQNVSKGSKAWFDGRTKKARKWFKAARKKLRNGKGIELIKEIKGTLNSKKLKSKAKKTLGNVVNYLERHIDHRNYCHYKELGFPIGSGMVESACKWLIQQRFKGVGMRWSIDGFNHSLYLRLAWVNNNFDDVFR